MKHRRRIFRRRCFLVRGIVGALTSALVSAPAFGQQQHTPPPPPDVRAIDRAARSLADSGFSGVVLVANGDRVLLRRGYGGVSAGSAFWIASMTKGFTAAAVLRLQQQGRLTVRDTLGRFFPGAPADKRGITIDQLLTHTSGIAPVFAGAGIGARDSAVRALLGRPLAFAPGGGYRYGDDDYELLAAVVEVASGRTWEEYVERELLRPAGLRRTGFWCRSTAGAPRPVAGADGVRSRCRPATRPGERAGDWGHRGATGMSSTADDLLRWTRVLERGGVLDSASRAALVAPRVLVRREGPADVYYGYGVRVYVVDGRAVEVMHSGSGDDGHTGIVRSLRDRGLTIVVLSNAGQHGGTTWSSYVARRLPLPDATGRD